MLNSLCMRIKNGTHPVTGTPRRLATNERNLSSYILLRMRRIASRQSSRRPKAVSRR